MYLAPKVGIISLIYMDSEKPKTILVVDDEPAIRLGLAATLKRQGYSVITAEDGNDGILKATQTLPDLILSDVMMPNMNGFELRRQLGTVASLASIPFIFLTARSASEDRVLGMREGADDYVTKPFSVRELMARVKAVLRRVQKEDEVESSTLLRGPGNLLMDVERRSVVVNNEAIELTRLEFDLLHRLLINPGRVLTRERLLEQAWGYEYVGDTRAVDSAVKRLRAKLRAVSNEADCIESVRGLGYRIN